MFYILSKLLRGGSCLCRSIPLSRNPRKISRKSLLYRLLNVFLRRFHKILYLSPPPYSDVVIGRGTRPSLSRLLREIRFTILHVLDHHFRPRWEHKRIGYRRLYLRWTVGHRIYLAVIVSLKEKLLLVILDRLLSTYGGEKGIIIQFSCRKIGR